MASTWSALKIELLETGQNSGTWGTSTNVNLGDAVLGEAITGQATVDFASDADVTITLTDSATTQAARNLRLNITESSTGIGSVRSLILGSGCQIEKFYLINNTGTGAKTVKNTSGTGISVPAGKATLVYNNGTNVVDAASYFSSLTLGSALPVASGGTGLTAGTSGGVLGYTATGTLASSVALTANALVLGAGAGATPTPMASLGTTTTVLHGNASGAPTFGAVSLTADVTGTLPTANGGTNLTSFTSGGVVYASSSSALATGSALVFDGASLGVGVTPNAWNTSGTFYKALQIGTNGSLFGLSGSAGATYASAVIASNAYYDGTNFKAIISDYAGRYQQFQGGHSWSSTASSVSAGNTVTFSQYMTLTNAGNLGVGTTAPNYRFEAASTSDVTIGMANSSSVTSGNRGTIAIVNSSNSTVGFIRFGADTDNVGTNLQFNVRPVAGSITEAMRIDSAGNVGIGTSSPTTFSGYTVLEVKGPSEGGRITANYNNSVYMTMFANSNGIGYVGTNSAHPAVFITSGTERARIDTSGNFLISKTTTAQTTRGVYFEGGGVGTFNSAQPDGGSSAVFYATTTGSNIGAITHNTAATSYKTSNTAGITGIDANTFTFETSSTERVRITSAGNVGIGTSSPGSKLDVNGDLKVSPNTAGKNTFSLTTNASNDGRLLIKSDTTDKVDIQANGTSYFEGGTVRFISTISVGNSTPSSSGAGITFPATQSASSNANTLDDYEEGTWTPTFFGTVTAGSPTYNAQLAAYTKVGRSVSVTCYINISNKGGMAGNIQISGLPFTSLSGGYYGAHAVAEFSGFTFAAGRTQLGLEQQHGQTNITIYNSGSGVGDSQQTVANTLDSTFIIFAGTYFV